MPARERPARQSRAWPPATRQREEGTVIFRRLITLLCLASALFITPAARADEGRYLLATASPGGTYYPVGVALATLVKVALQEDHGIELTAVATAGSAENARLLREGEMDAAILQGLVAYDARAGSGAFAEAGPDGTLRAITALWPNVEQFVVRAQFAEAGTIDDLLGLEGQAVALGDVNSGTLSSSRALLGNLGLAIEQDFQLVHLGYGPAAEALQRGEVAAVALPAGVPTQSLTRLKAAMGEEAVILAFTEAQARLADGGRNLWQRHRIPAGSYPGQPDDVMTIAQPNVLAVRAAVDEEDVYLITKAIYQNLPLLQSMHEATEAIALEKALAGLPLPLHPGAARYFRERGLAIPDHLIAE